MENEYVTLWTEDHSDILFARYTEKKIVTINTAKSVVEARMDFMDQQPHYIIIDFDRVRMTSREVRVYMNSIDGGLRGLLGGAFIAKTSLGVMIANFFLKVNKPPIPTKLFNNKEKAIKWINQLKTQQITR